MSRLSVFPRLKTSLARNTTPVSFEVSFSNVIRHQFPQSFLVWIRPVASWRYFFEPVGCCVCCCFLFAWHISFFDRTLHLGACSALQRGYKGQYQLSQEPCVISISLNESLGHLGKVWFRARFIHVSSKEDFCFCPTGCFSVR